MERLHSASSGAALEPMVSLQVVHNLADAAHAIAGVSRARLLHAANLAQSQSDAVDQRVSRSTVFRVCSLALELSGDPALGLHWSERITEGSFVPLSSIIPHAKTLRHALEAAARFNRLLSDEASYRLIEQGKSATLRRAGLSDAPADVERFASEMSMAGIVRIMSHFGVDPRGIRVSFRYSAPAYAAEYERVFGRAPRFDAPSTAVVFARVQLDLPAPQRDREVHDALSALAERRLCRITQQTPYALRLREVLLTRRGDKGQTMAAAARSLGLSARSLRRRLAEEGTSYHLVLRDALATVATTLLRDRERSIESIAAEMGFADASSFHRAFKKWTGATPSSFRSR